MSNTKSTLSLLSTPADAASLAKLYEKMTGKRPSPAEIRAAQREIDEKLGRSSGLNVPPKQ